MESTGSVEARAFGDRPIVSSNRPGRARRESGQLSTPDCRGSDQQRIRNPRASAKSPASAEQIEFAAAGRSTSVVCQNPRGRLSSAKRLRNFASANSRACLRALRFRAYLAGFHQVWKTEGTPIRSSLVPQRFCAAQTPDFPASVRVPSRTLAGLTSLRSGMLLRKGLRTWLDCIYRIRA